jgi:hypothetical protein
LNSETNYDKVFERLRVRLENLGAPVTLNFLGRAFRADRGGVERISGRPIHINAQNIIIWYLTFGGRGVELTPESYDFALLNHFSHGIFTGHTSWEKSRASGLSDLTPKAFRECCEHIGAEFLRPERYGESRLLFAFPELPLLITFTEGDDEFPASLDIKLGKNCERILPFETLAVLTSLIESEFSLGNVWR